MRMKSSLIFKSKFVHAASFGNLVSKFAIALFVMLFSQSIQNKALSQNTALTLNMKNVTIESVLNTIETKTQYRFLYNKELVDVSQKISISLNNAEINASLNEIFKGTGITYTINGKQIVLNKQDAKSVTGTVTDENGEPIIGASVLVKDTKKGTITNYEGSFSLDTDANVVLVISYIGYTSKEIKLNGQSHINVKLEEDTQNLDEVVVVGYGTQRKKDLTSSIATIGAAEIANQTVSNAMSSIQGRLAGVQITNSGSPGSTPSIVIRGTGSIYSSNPLYVVDGVIVNDISYLGPNDVESMSVLRDASASAIYGVQAANGVILVTTKRGTKDGKTKVSFNSYVGQKKASQLMQMANTSEWITLWNERMDFDGSAASLAKKLDPTLAWANTRWFNEVLSSSITDSEDINIQGGNDKSIYNIGLNHLTDNGLIKNDNYSKSSMRANYEIKVNKSIDVGMSLVVSATKSNPAPGGLLLDAFRAIPLFAPMSNDSTYTDPTTINGFVPEIQPNPSAKLFYNHQWANNVNAFANAFVNLKLLKNIELKSIIGFNPSYGNSINYSPKYQVSANIKNATSNISKNSYNNLTYSWDNTLTYSNSFKNSHNFKIMLGSTYRETTTNYLSGTATDIVEIPEINSSYLFLTIGKASATSTIIASDGGSKIVQIGYMGRVNYDYLNKYLFNFTMRADASSKFPENNRWGYFPSVGLGWVLSEENFIKNIEKINFMKLRGGWGMLGNSNIPSNLYQLTTSNGTSVIFGPEQNTGIGPVTPAVTIKNSFNPDLRWEIVNETNIGLDVAMFRNKLSTSLDWYYKLTQDAIFATTALGSTGLNANGVWGNFADILNTGVELSVSWKDKIGKFGYDIGINGTYNKNIVKSISASGASYYDKGDASNNITPLTRTMIGQSVGEFFGYNAIGVFQNQTEIDAYPHLQNTKPGHLIFEDVNGDKVLDAKDRTSIGNPNPPLTYGFSLGMNYNNFDFNVFTQGVFGNKIFNENRLLMYTTRNFDKAFYENRWTGEGTTNTYPSVLINAGDPRTISSFYVENGSYFRIKSVQIGYSLPKTILNKVKIDKLRFFVNAENPITFFKYNGFSPEVSTSDPLMRGVNNGVYPLSSIYSFGINLIF